MKVSEANLQLPQIRHESPHPENHGHGAHFSVYLKGHFWVSVARSKVKGFGKVVEDLRCTIPANLVIS